MIPPPPFALDEPGTILFTAERAYHGRALNRFCLSLRDPAARTAFLADETGYAAGHGLSDAETTLVAARDWTALLQAGGHLQAVLKLAATVGQGLWDIGAHNTATAKPELFASCPRVVSLVPGGW